MIKNPIEVIRAAAAEQRGFADQVIDPPKVKARFLEAAADLERAATLFEDTRKKLLFYEPATSEARFADRDAFVNYICDKVNIARLKEGLAVISMGSAAVCYDVLTEQRHRR